MKKILAVGMMLMMMGSAFVFAESENSAAMNKKEAKLVAISSSNTRINQMERRIDTLERDLHEQNDAIRSLERDLSDLRRRR